MARLRKKDINFMEIIKMTITTTPTIIYKDTGGFTFSVFVRHLPPPSPINYNARTELL